MTASDKEALRKRWLERERDQFGQRHLRLRERQGSAALGAWFLGPKAENEDLFSELINLAIRKHSEDRRAYFPDDPRWLTDARKNSHSYRESAELLRKELGEVLEWLRGSVPFFSYRYQAHMLWDTTLPGMLGYFAAMLYNQNNVAAEASPSTTFFEIEVGEDLCEMIGFPDAPVPWGHITCDGSVANMEALWAARNIKYYPLGVAAALKKEAALERARKFTIPLPDGSQGVLAKLGEWQLLNLRADDVLAIPDRLQTEYGLSPEAVGIVERYTLQQVGFVDFRRSFARKIADPVILAPGTMHYSWPKGAALLGMGRSRVLPVAVDLDARLDLRALRRTLDKCLRNKTPVAMVVNVVGTTHEGAVDPLDDVVNLREEYRKRGLEFWIHADAAWGAYFACMLPRKSATSPAAFQASLADVKYGARSVAGFDDADEDLRIIEPSIALNEHTERHVRALSRADSVTVDPHKSGYIPYPAGGLCYRNSAMRHLVAFTAPVVFHGAIDPTVGVYGIEGSKPGAAATAVYLSHRVISTDRNGYGRVLGRSMFNSKRLYAALVTMARGQPFKVTPVQRLPIERGKRRVGEKEIARELDTLHDRFVAPTNSELMSNLDSDAALRTTFRNLGSDQLIIACALNFMRNGRLNRDVEAANRLNTMVFERLSVLQGKPNLPETPMFVTSSELTAGAYGKEFVAHFQARLGVKPDPNIPVDFLILTTMDPWLTDTEAGNFIEKLIPVFQNVVLKTIEDL